VKLNITSLSVQYILASTSLVFSAHNMRLAMYRRRSGNTDVAKDKGEECAAVVVRVGVIGGRRFAMLESYAM